MNNDLQNKLQQFSAEPPEEVWNKIAGALDAEEAFAQRLYAYKEEPPAANWQKIEQQLAAQPEPGKTVPFSRRFTKPMRYIAVASLLAVTLVTITLTMKRTEAGGPQPDGMVTPAASVPVTAGTSQTNGDSASQHQFASPNSTTNEALAGSKSNHSGSGLSSGKPIRTRGERNTSQAAAPFNASLNDYVMYSDGNGNVMKISRKMETLVNCPDGDWPCKQRLQQLRQKMAAKAMTTDFTGILEMLQQLQ